MGKFLKRNKASSSRAATQAASKKKNSNGIVKRRVKQHKNGLEINEGTEY